MNGRETFVITLFIFLVGIVIGLVICARGNMFCPECGRRYIDAVYCEYCGTQLKEIQK